MPSDADGDRGHHCKPSMTTTCQQTTARQHAARLPAGPGNPLRRLAIEAIARLTRDMVERRFRAIANSAAVANRSFGRCGRCNFAMEKYRGRCRQPGGAFQSVRTAQALKSGTTFHAASGTSSRRNWQPFGARWRTTPTTPPTFDASRISRTAATHRPARAEGASLRWENIDLGTRQFTVPHEKPSCAHATHRRMADRDARQASS
jgi:hypothetical protein